MIYANATTQEIKVQIANADTFVELHILLGSVITLYAADMIDEETYLFTKTLINTKIQNFATSYKMGTTKQKVIAAKLHNDAKATMDAFIKN